MAIFRPGALIGAISGALGGVVFSNARGSRVIRHRPAVKGGAAPNHGTAQAAFRYAQSAWGTLTDEQRTSWRTYAPQAPVTNRLGEQHALNGFQAFVRFNIRTRMFELPLSTTPSSTFDTLVPTAIQLESTIAQGIRVLLSPNTTPPHYNFFAYGAMLMSLTPPRAYNNWKLLPVIFGTGAGFANYDTVWQTIFPLPILGQPIAMRFEFYTSKMRRQSSFVLTATTTA